MMMPTQSGRLYVDLVHDLIWTHTKNTGIGPTFLIVSNKIYHEIKADYNEAFWPKHTSKDPKGADRFMGLHIAISTGTNSEYMEVA